MPNKNNPTPEMKSAVDASNETTEVEVFQSIVIEDVKYKTRLTSKFAKRKKYEPKNPKEILSFIPGTIIKIYTSKGKKLKQGDRILDLEAMKMVNTIFAEANCQISDVHIKEGDMVPKNQLLITLK
jgi:biotin carboxyl carrier protein